MACEPWCFNRGCDEAPQRWLYILLLTFYVLGHLGSSFADNLKQYHYELEHIGQSSHEDGPVEFSLVFNNNDVIDHEEALERYRRATNEKIPTESTPHEQQRQQQVALQQPSSQSQLQQQQSQTIVNASNMPINVSYLTDYTTESSVATPSLSLTTVSTGEKEVVMTSAVPVSNQETSTPIYFRKNSSTKESVPFVDFQGKSNSTNDTIESKKQKDTETVVESTNNKDDSDGNIGEVSIDKFSDFTNKTLSQHNITKTEYDTHQYYNSTFIVDEAVGKKYWVDINNHPDLKVNYLLSQSHRRAATVKLKFDFPFYGHKVRNITIATGGFLYTGEYVHSWLAATQYIAPLMANFDTRLSNDSFVKYVDNGTAFTVVWEKVVLQDKPNAGAFTFQVTLHQNGDIVFVYSVIPLMVEQIEDTAHPVKVGLSDAYIMDRIVFFVRRKTIYEYHRVNFNRQDIKNWTVIYLNALPTCLEMDNCRDCLTKLKGFECKWCSELNQCSTGTFRSRQDWLLNGCDVRMIKEVDNCPLPTTTCKEHIDEYNHALRMHSEETVTVSEMNVKQEKPGTSPLERSQDNMNMGVSGIIGILLVISLIVGLAAWAAYAYRNPHSTSGQMLIRYRPSQWSWRRGEARYTAATIHM
ncbi:plexin domain-containing protein 2 isoform X1 [Apis mellifera caucasica]|uniref:Plexin domain-containing protein 2 isoform X1 n=2 Tax=Apis mellifera TaxID=7460 RepID=A0A7M7GPP4_APIME|nr:plexin domain-containing protein 2 isoform X1 [Apis mellifera]XP_016772475.1 plexin domain-containing protein 2 isoform X1 [Apis mellifera]KAG6796256.1 plexin domain-containing protein 2 isoform X1 [Apis mellifera caucasica]KAG9427980.1 plexin domain-containing protein 2 isoform X1 [Apis mellifera carnica]|eukprot:XP_006559439.1 plexin domain-containing protein 2 isoform X1 [Apis mellifera]